MDNVMRFAEKDVKHSRVDDVARKVDFIVMPYGTAAGSSMESCGEADVHHVMNQTPPSAGLQNQDFPKTMEELLGGLSEKGSTFLMAGQEFDVSQLMNCLNGLKMENSKLEDQMNQLQKRRDNLLAMNNRLAPPSLDLDLDLCSQSPVLSAAIDFRSNWKSLSIDLESSVTPPMINNPHYVSTANEFLLPHKATSAISKVQYTHEKDKKWLAISSWDATVRIFDLANPNAPSEIRAHKQDKAVLACTFAGNNKLALGGTERAVKSLDVASGAEFKIGSHDDTVRCMEYNEESDLVVSGSWDATVKFWDTRSKQAAGIAEVGDKVYALDVKKNRAVIGTKDRRVFIYDVRNLRQPEQVRDSPLKYQTRAIRCFPSGEAFVLSSIEGRVAVEYFDTNSDIQKDKYAFKCHRNKDESGLEQIYPVNALTFHPTYGTFASGGSDALVNIWDPFNRKRLYQFHRFPASIVSLSFSSDGSQLAIGSSYLYELEQTPMPLPENTVTVRKIVESETKVH